MGQVLHGSATTTEAVRRAIQHSQSSLGALAKRYGINQKTVAKWKKRTSVADLSTGPKELRTASELARLRTLANGPVSRTVRALVQKGLLRKAAVQPKGRSELLELTEEGGALMARDPSQALREAIAGLPDAEREALVPALEAVLCRFSTETPGP